MKYSKIIITSFIVTAVFGSLVFIQSRRSHLPVNDISNSSAGSVSTQSQPNIGTASTAEVPTSSQPPTSQNRTTSSNTPSNTGSTTSDMPVDSVVIQIALNEILKDLTHGVTDKTQLEFVGVSQSLTATYVDFKPVAYHEIPVEDETIRVEVPKDNQNSAKVVYGSYFKIKDLPAKPTISSGLIPDMLNGKVFTYSDIGGRKQSKTATRADIKESQKIILVIIDKDGIKHAYLAWKTQVFEPISWTVYTNALTGAELRVVQNFKT